MAKLVSDEPVIPDPGISGSPSQTDAHRTSAMISPLTTERDISGDNKVDTKHSDIVQKLREEVYQLQAEKNRLDGKLRGYQTLNELFQESKEDCSQLKKRNSELSSKIRQMDEKTSKLTCVNSPQGEPTVYKIAQAPMTQPTSPAVQAVPTLDKPGGISEPGEKLSVTGGREIIKELNGQVTQDSDVAPEEELLKFLPSIQSTGIPTSQYMCVSNSLSIGSQPVTTETSALLFNTSGNFGNFGSSADRFLIPTPVSYPDLETNTEETEGGNVASMHVADQLTNFVTQIQRLEKSDRAWKAFASTLQNQNQELKMKLRSTCQEKDTTLTFLKAENLRLLSKIKQLEHDRDAMSPSDSMSSQTAVVGAEFVHVTKEQVTAVRNDPGNTGDTALLLKIQHLELKNKQLYQANQEWVTFKQNIELMNDQKLQELRDQINGKERALTEYQIQDAGRQREIDKIVLTHKRTNQKLEEENEDLKTQLYQSKRQSEEVQATVTLLQQQQHEPLNQLSGPETLAAIASSPSSGDTRYQEVFNEKEALKHQLTVFQEDFNNERSDRAKAQSDKDDINRQLTETKKNLKRLHNQQKSTEQSLQSSLSENEQLHQQIANLRRQLNMSEESMRKCLEESERLRKEGHELKLKLSRQQDIMRPPVTRRPYYPPYAPQNPGWQEYAGMYPPQPTEPGPELLPGSWQCSKCTFVNFPRRTVCEVCGAVHQQKQQQQPMQYMPYHWQMANQGMDQHNQQVSQQLVPRGLDRLDGEDLICDNGGH